MVECGCFQLSVPGIVCAFGFQLSVDVSCVEISAGRIVRENLEKSFPEKTEAERITDRT